MSLAIILTALGLGFRHGVDWDHLAAISDLSTASGDRRRGFTLSMLYALGHAAVVFVLGAAVILAGASIPDSLDTWMGRIVGATLVLLAAVLLWQLARDGEDFRLRSRWMIIISGTFAGVRRIRTFRGRRVVQVEHDHDHDHEPAHSHEEAVAHDHAHVALDAPVGVAAHAGRRPVGVSARQHHHRHVHELDLPDQAFAGYGGASAAGIGMLHGVGVESPTQIAVFVAASSTAGRSAGFVLLGAWVLGLVVANGLLAALSGWGLLRAQESRWIYRVVGGVVAVSSLVLGVLLLAGFDAFPEILPT